MKINQKKLLKSTQNFPLKMQIIVVVTMFLQSCGSYSYTKDIELKEVKNPTKKNLLVRSQQ